MFVRRHMLIDARKATGRTQEEVAELVGVDRTTLGKWERDESTPHPTQRVRYAEALDVSMSELDAMLSNLPLRVNEMPSWLDTYLAMEQSATELRAHEPRAVYGLFQTAAYAREIVRHAFFTAPSASFLEETVAQRAYRQRRIRSGDLKVDVIQPEAALRLQLGGRAVMAEQLATMTELAALPNVTIRVATYEAGQYAARRLGDFVIMDHQWGKPRVHLEGYGGGYFISEPDEVAYFVASFDHACRIALAPRESSTFIRRLADAWSTNG